MSPIVATPRPRFVLAALAVAVTGAVACGVGPDEGVDQHVAALDRVDAAAGSDAAPRHDAGSTTRVRVVAANLTSGDQQSYDPGEGVRILQALAPDVVLLQEFNDGDGSTVAIRGFVDRTFGPSYAYVREGSGQIPNGIVSRYPILASGEWDDPQTASRAFVWARIDVPGDRDLWAVSVHLLTSSSGARQAEALALVGQVRATVPEADYLVIGGDLNTGSRNEACVRTLGAVVRGTAPFPVDRTNNWNTSRTRSKPLDWVLADRDLDVREVPVTLGGQTFPTGLVFDSRTFQPIASVPPVRPGDSAAPGMQHMAVVRDFAIPD
jgi:endonuclease/exonuclease/phosphatase family metal-dependent hydrolase